MYTEGQDNYDDGWFMNWNGRHIARFSSEGYLGTYNPAGTLYANGDENEIWVADVRTGKVIRRATLPKKVWPNDLEWRNNTTLAFNAESQSGSKKPRIWRFADR